MSESKQRVEKIRADQVRAGDRVKAPDGRAFHELTVAEHKPGLEAADPDRVELGTGWGSLTLNPDDIVERENWQTGDAAAEVESSMRSRLDDLAVLQRAANRAEDLSYGELAGLQALGVGDSPPEGEEACDVGSEAEERLYEYPLCVEATTTFEIVLGTGGPDDRILVECDVTECQCAGDHCGGHQFHGAPEPTYEIRRVLYRYSWTGSAERELYGDDLATAEEYARRVVPELAE